MTLLTKQKNRIVTLSVFTLLFITKMACANPINWNQLLPTVPNIDAEAYILLDYQSGKVLAEMNADTRRNPASLTKIMTSYVVGQALKAQKIHNEDIVTVNKDAWATGNPVFKGSSLMFLKSGDHVSVAELSRGIIVQSGNDACVAMADHIAGSQDAFVSLMNDYVKALGLKNTHFETVHGLDAPNQYSSARDMALLAKALIRDVPDEYAIYKDKEFTYNKIRQLNRNGLLWDTSLNVDGVKTGHTATAGFNLVASATNGNMRLISVVLGGRTFKGRETESKKLLTWGFRFFETVNPLQAGKAFISEPVWYGKENEVQLGVAKDAFVTIPRGRSKDLKASYSLSSPELHAPLTQNQVVGTIKFQLDGNVVDEQPLVVLTPIEKSGIFGRVVDFFSLKFKSLF